MASTPINASTLGATTIIAAVPSKRIRVRAYLLSAAGAVAAKWKSGATDVTGVLNLAAAGSSVQSGGVAPPDFLFEAAVGQPLVLDLSAAVAVSGHLTYSLD